MMDSGLFFQTKHKKQLTEDESEEQDYTKSDYEQALDGTVSEAQEAIEDFENPDYEKLIELEEEGKARETLLEFLESQK